MIGITMFFSAATVNVAGMSAFSCNGFVPCNDMPNAIRIIGTAELPIMLIGSKMQLGTTKWPAFAEIAETTMPSNEPMSSG